MKITCFPAIWHFDILRLTSAYDPLPPHFSISPPKKEKATQKPSLKTQPTPSQWCLSFELSQVELSSGWGQIWNRFGWQESRRMLWGTANIYQQRYVRVRLTDKLLKDCCCCHCCFPVDCRYRIIEKSNKIHIMQKNCKKVRWEK